MASTRRRGASWRKPNFGRWMDDKFCSVGPSTRWVLFRTDDDWQICRILQWCEEGHDVTNNGRLNKKADASATEKCLVTALERIPRYDPSVQWWPVWNSVFLSQGSILRQDVSRYFVRTCAYRGSFFDTGEGPNLSNKSSPMDFWMPSIELVKSLLFWATNLEDFYNLKIELLLIFIHDLRVGGWSAVVDKLSMNSLLETSFLDLCINDISCFERKIVGLEMQWQFFQQKDDFYNVDHHLRNWREHGLYQFHFGGLAGTENSPTSVWEISVPASPSNHKERIFASTDIG